MGNEGFLGAITMFAGNFAPRGFAFCNGELLSVSQNDALFSLLGTIYGGDGRTTFGLPDLRGRTPMSEGTGPGLTPRRIGAKFGVERVTLTTNELPPHSHSFYADGVRDNSEAPLNNSWDSNMRFSPSTPTVGAMASNAITTSGGSQSHTNMSPFLTINFIIALVGVYPSRS